MKTLLFTLVLFATGLGSGCAWALGPKQQKSPIDVKQYFTGPALGVRAEEIARFTPDVLTERWKNFPRKLPEESTPYCNPDPDGFERDIDCKAPLDREAIFDLNVRAAGLWNDLVECQSHDPEAARQAYFKMEALCPGKADSERMKTALKTFASQVDDFLLTSSFDYDLYQRQTKVPALHPMLSQILVENLLSVRFLMQEKHKIWTGEYFFSSSSLETNQYFQDCFSDKSKNGLNYERKPCELDRDHTAEYWARIYRNTHRLLSVDPTTIEGRGCSRYGLFPFGTLIASAGIGFFTGQSFIYGIGQDDSEPWLYRGSDQVTPSCWFGDDRLFALLTGSFWGQAQSMFPGKSWEAYGNGNDAHMNMVADSQREFYRMRVGARK